MKALTVFQPYASAIADNMKWVENRSWGTKHRGPLVIHAGSGTKYLSQEQLGLYPTRRCLCVVNVVACLDLGGLRYLDPARPLARSSRTIGEILKHPHTHGPKCLVFDGVERLIRPLPIGGMQKLWDVDEGEIFERLTSRAVERVRSWQTNEARIPAHVLDFQI